jgi:hypothetical protein
MGRRLQEYAMRWHKVDAVLGSRWELRSDERILAQAWQIRGSVYRKLGVFGSSRQAESLDQAKAAAVRAIVSGERL